MKKSILFVLFVLVVCVFCLISCGDKTADIDKAIEAYCDFMERENLHEWHFALCYIDEDDIPELVVSGGNSHPVTASIYTYGDGKVTEIGYAGSFGEFKFAPKQSSIISSYLGMGELYEMFYTVKDGALEQVKYFKDDSGTGYYPEGKMTFKINDIEVSEEEYNTELESMRNAYSYLIIGYENGFAIDENLSKLKDNWQDFLIEE